MAEIIGVIASGVSIVQLGGQIAQSLVKIKGYWDEVKDAPEEIKSLLKDIEVLCLILFDFEEERRRSRLPNIVFDNRIFDQSLLLCSEAAVELSELANPLASQISSKRGFYRKRGALHVVLKHGQIKRCKSRLKRALSLLSLSHQCYTRAIFRLQLEALSTVNSNVVAHRSVSADNQSRLCDQCSPGANSPRVESSQMSNDISGLSNSRANSGQEFESTVTFLGSISISHKRFAKSQLSQNKITVNYRMPTWLGYRKWQLCCHIAQMRWNLSLSTHNIVPTNSRQLQYAKFGCLSKLQHMISNKEASIFDETERGNSVLSIAALNGQEEVCRWLLQQGARTDHMRFGSILSQILYYGGSISFEQGISTLEVIRLFQSKEERDIFDCSSSDEESCSFYGRSEVLTWLMEQSRSLGYQHTIEEKAQLAINIARNTHHNGPHLVRTALAGTDPYAALQAKNDSGVTLLHRIASRIAGTFAYEAQAVKKDPRGFNSDISFPQESTQAWMARSGWRSLLRELNLKGVDIHAVTNFEEVSEATAPLTPLTMGIRTLIFLWVDSTSQQVAALSAFLHAWLSDLENHGVNLLTYGEEEKRLYQKHLPRIDFHRRKPESKRRVSNRAREIYNPIPGGMHLINFIPNACAEKWQFWWSDPTDEFAGEFWRMSERTPVRTPGAWDEDSDF